MDGWHRAEQPDDGDGGRIAAGSSPLDGHPAKDAGNAGEFVNHAGIDDLPEPDRECVGKAGATEFGGRDGERIAAAGRDSACEAQREGDTDTEPLVAQFKRLGRARSRRARSFCLCVWIFRVHRKCELGEDGRAFWRVR